MCACVDYTGPHHFAEGGGKVEGWCVRDAQDGASC